MSENIENSQLVIIIEEMKKSISNPDTVKTGLEVLVIDDDKWMHRIISKYMNEVGLKTKSSFDAFEGIALAVESSPLLIFLDIMMPEVNGDILLKMLKKIKTTQSIPVIIMSGNLNKDVLTSTYKNGASGFLSKPFTKELLFNKVKECFKGKAKANSV